MRSAFHLLWPVVANLTKNIARPIVLPSSPSVQTAPTVGIVLVIGSNEGNVKEVGDALKSKLNVKGGGKGFGGVEFGKRAG